MKRRVLLSGAVALITVAAAAVATAAGAAVPPTPSGWTLVWSDDFTGATNTLPSSANWIIDTGTSYPGGPANWGTGEIQTYTNSTAQRPPRRHRQPADHPDPQRLGGSGPRPASRPPRTNFKAPSGGVLRIEGRIQMPNVTGAGRGRLLAGVLGARRAVPRQLLELAGHRRVRHHGERQRHQLGLGRAALRRRPGRAVQRVQRPRRQPGLPRARPASRRSTPTASSGTRASARSSCAGTSTASSYHTVTQTQVGEPHWTNMTSHAGYFILLNVAMGGAFPNGVAGSATPTAATVSGRADAGRLRGRLHPRRRHHAADHAADRRHRRRRRRGQRLRARSRPRRSTRRPACRPRRAARAARTSAGSRNGDWARYDNVELRLDAGRATSSPGSPPARAAASAAWSRCGWTADSNAPIGSFAVANTGGWQTWRTIPGNVVGGDRHAHGLPDVHQRPADRLRQRQLVPLPQLGLIRP